VSWVKIPPQLQATGLVPVVIDIADTIDQKVIKICVSVGQGLQWSPSSNGLASLTPDVENNNLKGVQILDLERWKLVQVAYQIPGKDDTVIGWRED